MEILYFQLRIFRLSIFSSLTFYYICLPINIVDSDDPEVVFGPVIPNKNVTPFKSIRFKKKPINKFSLGQCVF